MKHATVIIALATFSFFSKPVQQQQQQQAANLAPLGVEVTCEPSSRSAFQLLRRPTPNTYHCNAYVFDAGDLARGVAEAQVIVAAGERRNETRNHEDTTISFTVAISKTHDRAATDVVVTKAKRPVLRQKSNVVLLAHARH